MVMRPAPNARAPRLPRWLRRLFINYERRQRRADSAFWKLVNHEDNDWLNYDPSDRRLRFWHRKEDQ